MYGAGKGARLREIKRRYDPHGVFTGHVPVLPVTRQKAELHERQRQSPS
ncbi:BBE domain-containing protein [Actinacidiphila oryziradicis]|uniref:Berberine/berberine-like domain-containing protein n=1 Tax=Actinacidiphila oryziradicis TaxID=2571141 RepID=A0A4U0RUZ3_9ACTN|nr:hypothetical protein FCI23_46285 [Actinacidiphila oryziradicis]